MKYRKTALIEAEQYVGGEAGLSPDFSAALCWSAHPGRGHYVPHIHTLEGRHDVGLFDWIARGIKGELWPIKPDIFAATYEPVTTHSTDTTTPRPLAESLRDWADIYDEQDDETSRCVRH